MSKTASINMRVEPIQHALLTKAELVAPTPDNTKLKTLLTTPSPWEK
ncbi:hypothetical protein [Photorhabdus temperata]|nr:hypothetical protein [Photorhabdus temperata]